LNSLEIVDSCPDPVRRFAMREALARGAGIPLEQLAPVAGARIAGPRQETAEAPAAGEWVLLRALVLDLPEERRAEFLSLVPLSAIDHPVVRAIIQKMQELYGGGEVADLRRLLAEFDDEHARRILAGLETEAPSVDEERFRIDLREVLEKLEKHERAEHTRKIHEAEKGGDKEALSRLKVEANERLKLRKPQQED
jgi:hypothetical protein